MRTENRPFGQSMFRRSCFKLRTIASCHHLNMFAISFGSAVILWKDISCFIWCHFPWCVLNYLMFFWHLFDRNNARLYLLRVSSDMETTWRMWGLLRKKVIKKSQVIAQPLFSISCKEKTQKYMNLHKHLRTLAFQHSSTCQMNNNECETILNGCQFMLVYFIVLKFTDLIRNDIRQEECQDKASKQTNKRKNSRKK